MKETTSAGANAGAGVAITSGAGIAAPGNRRMTVFDSLRLLVEPGSVVELRAIGVDGRIASGFFDDLEALANAVEPMDASGDYRGVYVTLNPVDPALLARRANRVQARLGRGDATTADGDVLRRRWLPVDIDPVRPSGISSTDAEHEAAILTAEAVRDYLDDLGWSAPVVADSGNGAHLLYRIDLPNDDASTALVKGVLATLDARFSNDRAKVDTANHNAARIWKCYGTVSRKGDSIRDRPHRRSSIVSRPEAPGVVSVDRLRALAGDQPPAAPAVPPVPSTGSVDLRAWLAEHNLAVAMEKPWQGGTLFTLHECPFSDAHADGAYAVQFGNGAVHAGCKHDSCGGGRQRWPELRSRFEPGRAEPPPPPAPVVGAADPAKSPALPDEDPAVVATAKELLETGDPLRYFLDAFERDHVGDTALAKCLVMSIASQSVWNSRGLHVYVTGESGKGKSSGMTAMLRQVPEEFRLAERMSNKALYYSDDLRPGTVLLLDDITLSEELQEVLKEATSRFAEPVCMRTVDKDRRIRHCSIPERCTWWLANVSALYDEQVLNRMLICWVDDSRVQDDEVCRRYLADEARHPRRAVADRIDLRVCRAVWRTIRAEGLVYVYIPFAERIRLASSRNRRNPLVLLDLIRSHALLRYRQRACERLPDGMLVVTATGEDFDFAARLFTELHTTGGSLGAKFDRNEDRLLAIASRSRVERFTLREVQQWTGWTYQAARRTMLGYTSRGVRYPGLLDRSPALGLIDQTAVADDDGRDARQRQYVFLFDDEVYRETLARGDVWLDDGHDGDSTGGCCQPAVTAAVTEKEGRLAEGSAIGDISSRIEAACVSSAQDRGSEETTGSTALCADPADHTDRGTGYSLSVCGSGVDGRRSDVAAGVTAPVTAGFQQHDCCTSLDPRDFTALDAAVHEPCVACGRSPSAFRERRPAGTPRYLCRACHAAAVRREQRAGPPLPDVIDPVGLERVGASVGRCDVCGLAPAAFAGGGVRLCEACFRRESRRALQDGEPPPLGSP